MSYLLVEFAVINFTLLQLLVLLHHIIKFVRFILVVSLSHFNGSVDMLFKVGWGSQLEQVSVKSRHLWLNVIKEISLLHV